ncbi:hypothetical protein [Nocardia huaxiensis]|uniref:Uncharacterized protein n=1 Tax=Nocardia huaxiensis TaxID=2755382 RepID=A0A7D6VF99_9NOCA|nr:hypothetical protein [Nocardia huaxiensis]QLY33693.1 hypothetical protein H0264_16960 [Nocardia huaxiensis]UFS99385.1 hypothetical protein LPY97_16560 [Nocardia huaxiensis]
MAIQGFLNILFDTYAPNRGWRYCVFCDATGTAGFVNGNVVWCSTCGGTGWVAEPTYYER